MALDDSAWPSSADFPDMADISILARGAHATVYRAYQVSSHREVALKVDNRVLTAPGERQRFEQEVRAVGSLAHHPGIIDTYIAGITGGGNPFVVTELCRSSYERELAEQGPLPPDEVQRIGIRVSDALAMAHESQVCHRDIKPANILLNRDSEPVLADFGVASLMDSRRRGPVVRAAMTPAYAPLETFHMQPSGEAGDVYSLAATLYALLSGRPPRFPEDDRDLTLDDVMALCQEPIPDIPGVSQVLLGMLRAAMTNNPTGRPTAAQFRDMLESVPVATAVIVAAPGPAGPPQPTEPPPMREFTPEPATTVLRQRRPSLPDPGEEPVTATISSHATGGHRIPEEPARSPGMEDPVRLNRVAEPPPHLIRPDQVPARFADEEPPTRVIRTEEPPTHVIRSDVNHPDPRARLLTPDTTDPRPGGAVLSPPPPRTLDAEPAGDWAVSVPVREEPPRRPSPGPGAWGRAGRPPQPFPDTSPDDSRLPVLAPKPGELKTRRERRIAARGGEERSGLPRLIMACGAILAVVVVLVVMAVNFLSDDTPVADETASNSTTACPVEKLGVSCLEEPKCFAAGAITDDDGFAIAESVPCDEPHGWEAYARGELPEEVDDPSYQAVSKVKAVDEACLGGGENGNPLETFLGAQASDWRSDVLPPTKKAFDEGDTVFLCVATPIGDEELNSPVFTS